MRIALVTHQFFPRFYTGVERLALNMSRQLGRLGHEPVVYTSRAHSADAEEYVVSGTSVRTFRIGHPDPQRPWAADPRVVEELMRALVRDEIEVVHIYQPLRLPGIFAAARAAGLPAGRPRERLLLPLRAGRPRPRGRSGVPHGGRGARVRDRLPRGAGRPPPRMGPSRARRGRRGGRPVPGHDRLSRG